MTPSKIDLVKDYLAAAARQDVPAMLSLFADDLVYRVPGAGPLAGTYRGKNAPLEYYGRIMAMSEGSYAIENIVDWLESETRVALIADETVTRKGRTVRWQRTVLFRFAGDKVAEVSLFDDRLDELDALLLA